MRIHLSSVNSYLFYTAGEKIAQKFAVNSHGFTVGIFKSLKDEIDTSLISNCFEKLLFPHSYSSPEEYAIALLTSKVKYIFVPALAFDHSGHRLGRGRGYYDKCIYIVKQFLNRPQIIGLSLTCQVFDAIPRESHDQTVDLIMTPDTDISLKLCL